MRRPKSKRPQVEALESKLLLATYAPAAPVGVAAVVGSEMALRRISLDGTVRGIYQQAVIGNSGTTLTLTGSGQVSPLGRTDVAGALRITGSALAHAEGELTLSGQQGTLTLDVTGPSSGGVAPLSSHLTFDLTFVITGGTGQFRGATGSGRISLTLLPSRGGASTAGGQFVMSFAADHSPQLFVSSPATGA